MADNYIERKLEEHRAKQAAGRKPMRTAAGLKPGHIQVPFPPKRVLVIGESAPFLAPLVEAFRKTGSRVAFCGSDEKQGRLTAESTGSLFIPGCGDGEKNIDRCLQTAAKRWGAIDVLICLPDSGCAAETAAALFARHRQSGSEPCGLFITIRHSQDPDSATWPTAAPGITAFAILLTPPRPEVRTATADDLARLCLFLCMERNDFLSGREIRIGYGDIRIGYGDIRTEDIRTSCIDT